MKSSVRFREDQRPLLKLKLPVKVLGIPLSAGASVGEKEDLALHIGTSFDVGPSWRIVHHPNEEVHATSLVLKAGFGAWGAPTRAIFSVSAEFDLSSGLLSSGKPSSLMLRVTPHLGDFSVRRDGKSQIRPLDKKPAKVPATPFARKGGGGAVAQPSSPYRHLKITSPPQSRHARADAADPPSLADTLRNHSKEAQQELSPRPPGTELQHGAMNGEASGLEREAGADMAASSAVANFFAGTMDAVASTEVGVIDGGTGANQDEPSRSRTGSPRSTTSLPSSSRSGMEGLSLGLASDDSCVYIEAGPRRATSPPPNELESAADDEGRQGEDVEERGDRTESGAARLVDGSQGHSGRGGLKVTERSRWLLGVHSQLPIGQQLLLKFRWGIRMPSSMSGKGGHFGRASNFFSSSGLPVLVLDKITLQSLELRRLNRPPPSEDLALRGLAPGGVPGLAGQVGGSPGPAEMAGTGQRPGGELARISVLSTSVADQLSSVHAENIALRKALEDLRADFSNSACAKKTTPSGRPASVADLFMHEDAMLRAQAGRSDDLRAHSGGSGSSSIWEDEDKVTKPVRRDARKGAEPQKDRKGQPDLQADVSEELRKALERATGSGR